MHSPSFVQRHYLENALGVHRFLEVTTEAMALAHTPQPLSCVIPGLVTELSLNCLLHCLSWELTCAQRQPCMDKTSTLTAFGERSGGPCCGFLGGPRRKQPQLPTLAQTLLGGFSCPVLLSILPLLNICHISYLCWVLGSDCSQDIQVRLSCSLQSAIYVPQAFLTRLAEEPCFFKMLL